MLPIILAILTFFSATSNMDHAVCFHMRKNIFNCVELGGIWFFFIFLENVHDLKNVWSFLKSFTLLRKCPQFEWIFSFVKSKMSRLVRLIPRSELYPTLCGVWWIKLSFTSPTPKKTRKCAASKLHMDQPK